MITVIDYGMGNLRSVVKAVEKYTPRVRISSNPDSLRDSTAVILPGDGAFGMAKQHLDALGWTDLLRDYIMCNGFFMGICLGFQLLFESSEEFGHHKGLGIIPGQVRRFSFPHLKVPHMGWNNVRWEKESKFIEKIPSDSYFYFIHSYYPTSVDPEWVVGTVEYGIRFPCVVSRGNLIATQFHPEKSHIAGLKIIENFVRHACS
ncbi:MAG: imidazole glycerol phosphate synthase subunit HisH [Spirochaetes bacterium]|nr:imidazole glycerol phosphate synthase subunit HisH [Spirochaetota bacterium]